MSVKTAVITVVVSLFFCTGSWAQGQWQGYINSKTFPDKPYGYLFTRDQTARANTLRLICHAPESYLLYLPDTVVQKDDASLTIAIDSLPPMRFSAQRVRGGIALSNRSNRFWKLLAQMVAGAQMSVSGNSNPQPIRYDLRGFTDSYTRYCGWLDSSRKYAPHLKSYR